MNSEANKQLTLDEVFALLEAELSLTSQEVSEFKDKMQQNYIRNSKQLHLTTLEKLAEIGIPEIIGKQLLNYCKNNHQMPSPHFLPNRTPLELESTKKSSKEIAKDLEEETEEEKYQAFLTKINSLLLSIGAKNIAPEINTNLKKFWCPVTRKEYSLGGFRKTGNIKNHYSKLVMIDSSSTLYHQYKTFTTSMKEYFLKELKYHPNEINSEMNKRRIDKPFSDTLFEWKLQEKQASSSSNEKKRKTPPSQTLFGFCFCAADNVIEGEEAPPPCQVVLISETAKNNLTVEQPDGTFLKGSELDVVYAWNCGSKCKENNFTPQCEFGVRYKSYICEFHFTRYLPKNHVPIYKFQEKENEEEEHDLISPNL